MRWKCIFSILLHLICGSIELQGVSGTPEKREKTNFYDGSDSVGETRFYTGWDKSQSNDQWPDKVQPYERYFPLDSRSKEKILPAENANGGNSLSESKTQSHYVRQSLKNMKFYEPDTKNDDNSLEKMLLSEQKVKLKGTVKNKLQEAKQHRKNLLKKSQKGLVAKQRSRTFSRRRNPNDYEASVNSEHTKAHRRGKHYQKIASSKFSTPEVDNVKWEFDNLDEEVSKQPNIKPKTEKQRFFRRKGRTQIFEKRKNTASTSLDFAGDAASLFHPFDNPVQSRTLADFPKQTSLGRTKLSKTHSNEPNSKKSKSDKFSDEESKEVGTRKMKIGDHFKINSRKRKPHHNTKTSDQAENSSRGGSWNVLYPIEKITASIENQPSSNTQQSQDYPAYDNWAVVNPTSQADQIHHQGSQIIQNLKVDLSRQSFPKIMSTNIDSKHTHQNSSDENVVAGEAMNQNARDKSREEINKYNQGSNNDARKELSDTGPADKAIHGAKSPSRTFENRDSNKGNEQKQAENLEERYDDSADDPAANNNPDSQWINRKQLEKILSGKHSIQEKAKSSCNDGKPEAIKSSPESPVNQTAGAHLGPSNTESSSNSQKEQQDDTKSKGETDNKKQGDNPLPQGAENVDPAAQKLTTPAESVKKTDRFKEAIKNKFTPTNEHKRKSKSKVKLQKKSTESATQKVWGKEIRYAVFDPPDFNAAVLRSVLQESTKPMERALPHCTLEEYQRERAENLQNVERESDEEAAGKRGMTRCQSPSVTKSTPKRQAAHKKTRVHKKLGTKPAHNLVALRNEHLGPKSEETTDLSLLSDIMEGLIQNNASPPKNKCKEKRGAYPENQEEKIINKYLAALMEERPPKNQQLGNETQPDSHWLEMLLAELVENRMKTKLFQHDYASD